MPHSRDSQEKRFLAAASRFKRVLCVPLVVFALFALAGCEDDENAPAAPANVATAPGDTQITISWDEVTGADSYNLYWSTTSGVTKSTGTQIAGVTTPHTHTSLSNGTPYYYVVTAVNGGGESADSTEVNATPIITEPSGVSATAADTQVTVSWDSVTDATGYNLYWATSAGVFKSTGTQIEDVTSPHAHTGLTNGTAYYYVVTAVDAASESSESAEVDATPAQDTVAISGSITHAAWSAGDYLVWAMPNGEFTSPIGSASATGATSATYSLTVEDDAGTIMLVVFNDVDGNDDYDTGEAIEFACDIAITAGQDVTQDVSNLDSGNFTNTPCQ